MTAFANEVFTANSEPQVRVNALKFPIIYAQDLRSGKALIDLYDLVGVIYDAKDINHQVRVTGIEHEITLDHWDVGIAFAPNGAVASPQVTPTVVNSLSGGSSGPFNTGMMMMWAGPSGVIPTGWVVCQGQEVARVGGTYGALFDVIGTAFGAGNGTSTYNLPSSSMKFPLGVGLNVLGSIGGDFSKAITAANLPPHAHTAGTLDASSAGGHTHIITRKAGVGTATGVVRGNTTAEADATTDNPGGHVHPITGSTGNGPGTSTLLDVTNPYFSVYYIIKL
jgi:microcystin-dependent protein